jgi:cell filamentation protein
MLGRANLFPRATWILRISARSIIIYSKTSSIGRALREQYAFSKQGSAFCFPEHIEAQATKLFSDLKAKKYLEKLPTKEFAENAAHFLAELNAIHAFRKGNGRTQLTFFALLADRAGHTLDLEKLDPNAMLHAMIASFDGEESELTAVINGLIS